MTEQALIHLEDEKLEAVLKAIKGLSLLDPDDKKSTVLLKSFLKDMTDKKTLQAVYQLNCVSRQVRDAIFPKLYPIEYAISLVNAGKRSPKSLRKLLKEGNGVFILLKHSSFSKEERYAFLQGRIDQFFEVNECSTARITEMVRFLQDARDSYIVDYKWINEKLPVNHHNTYAIRLQEFLNFLLVHCDSDSDDYYSPQFDDRVFSLPTVESPTKSAVSFYVDVFSQMMIKLKEVLKKSEARDRISLLLCYKTYMLSQELFTDEEDKFKQLFEKLIKAYEDYDNLYSNRIVLAYMSFLQDRRFPEEHLASEEAFLEYCQFPRPPKEEKKPRFGIPGLYL